MGAGFVLFTTAAFISLAVLVVTLNYATRKEYTEEMERMRRDLAAARDKNGVYLATDNYNQMIIRLEAQQQEIGEKIANIRALNEEMEKKEVICQDLGISLEQRTDELRQKEAMLGQTIETLHSTEVELKATIQDRDEHQHLVETHVATEKQLGQQAHKLLAVADESTTDTYRLHEKLARKRSVENENSEISRDFRYGFQKQIVAMEDGLTQYTEEQQKLCSELRNNHVLHLEKGNKGYEAISDQMSTLVGSFNQLVQDLQQRTSDQVSTSQQWLQQFLTTAQSRSDAETNTLHQFLVEFAPKMQNIVRLVESMQMDTQDTVRYVNQKLAHQQDLIQNYVSSQTQMCGHLKDTLLYIVKAQHGDLLRTKEQVESFTTKKQIQKVNFLNKIIELVEAEKLLEINDNETSNEIGRGFLRVIEKGDQLVKSVVDNSAEQAKCTKDFSEVSKTNADDVSVNFNGYVVRTTSQLNEAKISHDALESSVNTAVRGAETGWKDNYSWTEREMRLRSKNIVDELQTQQDMITELTTVVRNSAVHHEASLERERITLGTFVSRSENDLEAQCSHLEDFRRRMMSELRDRDQDIDKFISEDLRKDVATGATPNRKDFTFPRDLVVTSPHERILARYRAMNTQMADERTENESSFQVTSSESDVSDTTGSSEEIQDAFTVQKSASTSDLTTFEKIDMNISVQSEPGYVHENKENGRNLFIQPVITKKQIAIKSGPTKEKVNVSGNKRPLTVHNKRP